MTHMTTPASALIKQEDVRKQHTFCMREIVNKFYVQTYPYMVHKVKVVELRKSVQVKRVRDMQSQGSGVAGNDLSC